MLSISSRVAAIQRSRLISGRFSSTKSFWTLAPSYNHKTATHTMSNFPMNTLQRRTYIFFPSTIDDMLKLLKSQSNEGGRVMVKLSIRWHDQLGAVLDRYDKLLKRTSATVLSNVKSTQTTLKSSSGSTASRTISRYKTLKTWGMNRLMTHYNAKKRVFAKRRKAFKTLRRMNAVDAKVYREQFYTQKRLKVHQVLTRLRARVERKRDAVRDWLLNADRQKLTAANSSEPQRSNSVKETWKSLTLVEPSQQSWFDAQGCPLTSREETGRFVNPWLSQSTNGENGLRKFLRWKTESLMKKLGLDLGQEESICSKHQPSGHLKPIYRHETLSYTATAFDNAASQTIKLAWLGHATTLVSFPGNFIILTDPHFSNYAGPMKRNDPPPISVMELPAIDCVLISHDHMDHLDYWSILELVDSNKVNFWVVPLGIKEWLINKAGVCPDDIIELEWWEAVRLSKKRSSNGDSTHTSEVVGVARAFDKISGESLDSLEAVQGNRDEITITSCPAQHWCSRTPFDRNHRLWCSYAVHATPALRNARNKAEQPTHSFYFAGDTGLPPEFPLHYQIGDRLGPFDLAAIPIGAYEPRWFMKESHCDPAEAVVIHQAIQSRKSVAIHFDTFNLAEEPQSEPPRLLVEEVDRVNEEIKRLAAEVEAVADELKAVVGKDEPTSVLAEDEVVECRKHESLEETTKLNEILPPLVDFAVIKQGHLIESSSSSDT